MMKECTGEFKINLQLILVLAVVEVVVAFLIGRASMVTGLLVGNAASIVYVMMMYHSVRQSAYLSPQIATIRIQLGWLLRLTFFVAVLILVLKVGHIDFWGVVIGVFSFHVALVLRYLVAAVKFLFLSP